MVLVGVAIRPYRATVTGTAESRAYSALQAAERGLFAGIFIKGGGRYSSKVFVKVGGSGMSSRLHPIRVPDPKIANFFYMSGEGIARRNVKK
jgi:hypothetical protein